MNQTNTPEHFLEGTTVINLEKENNHTEKPHISATQYNWKDAALLAKREYICGKYLIRGFVSATVAPGGVGKSTLITAETLSMVSGKDLLKQGVGSPIRVWLWNLEDPLDELQRRLQAACQHYNLTSDDLGDRLFVDSGRKQDLCIAKNGKNGPEVDQAVIDNLIDEIKSKEIDLLIVDPFVSSHGVSENDNVAIDLVVKAWGKIADRTNAAIHLIHHTRKQSSDNEINSDSARGAKALVDAARDVRAINRMTEDEGAKAGVDNHRLYFRVYSDKANLSPPADKSEWYKLESTRIANGDDVGVVIPWKWPGPFDGISTHNVREIQKAIKGKQLRESSQAKDWIGHTIADVLDLDASNPADKQKIKLCINTWKASGILKVSMIRERGKDRPIMEVGEWI